MASLKLSVNIEKGMSDGSSLSFQGAGEQQPKKIPGDLTLKLKQQKHPVFKRQGNDLHANVKISLREASRLFLSPSLTNSSW